MARIKYSGLIDSINGSVGGTTFQNNAYGFTIKRKPNMIRPLSADQNERKLIFSRVARAWRELSDAQRASYNTYASASPQYAKNNPSSQLTGYAVFMKYNSLRVLTGQSILNTAPVGVPASVEMVYTIIRDGSSLYIEFNRSSGAEDWNLLCFVSRRFGDSQNFIGTSPFYFGFRTSQSYITLPITNDYPAKFGYLPDVGDRLALSVVAIGILEPYVLARDANVLTVEAP